MNRLPILGWGLSAIASFGLSVPFWLFWTVCGMGGKYFYWIPKIYHNIPFWHCFSLFIICAILKGTIVPKFSSVSQKNETNVKN